MHQNMGIMLELLSSSHARPLTSLRDWQCLSNYRSNTRSPQTHAKDQGFLTCSKHETLRNTHLQCRRSVETAATARSGALAIEVLDVSKSFGDKQVLSNASLAVPPGSFHMLLGPNGCGKSTLLRILGGLMPPDNGSCSLQRPAGFVFQNPDHQVVMPTVGADVAFGLGRFDLQERMVREHVLRMLCAVNLEGFIDRQTHTLSGGQKQRVAIAGALAQCPKVLLLDELTTFLDGEDQRGVLEAVRSCVGGPDQVTALWVTHRLEELEWADSVSYMDRGCIQFTGSPREAADYLTRLGAHV